MMKLLLLLLLSSSLQYLTNSFTLHSNSRNKRKNPTFLKSSLKDAFNGLSELDAYLKKTHPSFSALIAKNDDFWDKLREGNEDAEVPGFTIFAPNEAAFSKLEEKQKGQLKDPRNKETSDKIGMCHAVGEVVTAESLFDSGGVMTVGGATIPIGRGTSGGFLGIFGAKEDGSVTLNGAKILTSTELAGGRGLVHEVDNFVSPQILWRYMDQLRIPGSS